MYSNCVSLRVRNVGTNSRSHRRSGNGIRGKDWSIGHKRAPSLLFVFLVPQMSKLRLLGSQLVELQTRNTMKARTFIYINIKSFRTSRIFILLPLFHIRPSYQRRQAFREHEAPDDSGLFITSCD